MRGSTSVAENVHQGSSAIGLGSKTYSLFHFLSTKVGPPLSEGPQNTPIAISNVSGSQKCTLINLIRRTVWKNTNHACFVHQPEWGWEQLSSQFPETSSISHHPKSFWGDSEWPFCLVLVLQEKSALNFCGHFSNGYINVRASTLIKAFCSF